MIASACSRSATTEAAFWRERAERLAAENARLAAQNTTLAGTVAAQREQLAALKQRVVTLSRAIAMLSFQGLDVAPGTLAGVARRLDQLLAPLAAAIAARNAVAGRAHADETSWRVFGQPADNGGNRWWLWVWCSPDTVVYQIAPSRSLKVLEGHYGLAAGQLPEGRGPLVLSSDFYSVYQSFSEVEGVTPLWCWAHIRRRFIRAGDAHRKNLGSWADAWTARIGVLYAAHRRLAAVPDGTSEHARAGAAFAAALEEIDAHRRIQGARPDLLHPAATKVLATLDREWDGLSRHRDFPELPLDNNQAERAIRTPVVGRKNYNGSGSRWAAELAGHAWTILGTARIAGHNPRAYLDTYLRACAAIGWHRADGRRKDMTARVALNRMHADGLITLPPPRHGNSNGRHLRHGPAGQLALPIGPAPVTATLAQIAPLQLVPVTSRADSARYNQLIRDQHYLATPRWPALSSA